MAYQNGNITDDVTWSPKLLWGSTVDYPSDSLASCSVSQHPQKYNLSVRNFTAGEGCHTKLDSGPWTPADHGYKINVKKLTSLKLIVRTMWWYHSTKTAKIFRV